MKVSKSDRDKAIEQLRTYLKPGDTVHCVLRHVSRSGMSRRIDFYKMVDGQSISLTANIAKLLDYRCQNFDQGLTVSGCGMDMGFAAVYHTAATLWRDGFDCTGEKCPSNDHSNGDRDYSPHKHKDGGYALQHKWL